MFRTLLAIIVLKRGRVRQYDIGNAFLYADTDTLIFMEPPEGLNATDRMVCQLLWNFYSLKQAPTIWNKKLEEVLVKLGMTASIQEPCLYHAYDDQGNLLILLVWVDDIFTFSFGTEKLEQKSCQKLKRNSKCQIKGNVFMDMEWKLFRK